ncbi:General alpha-glucoside permease [Madurella mycetomatis]|nr:General alpha-glucoside permease [Madurella mycetomatis]
MVEGIEKEKTLMSGVSLKQIWQGANLRRTILCIGVYSSRAASGLWVFIAYGTYFFQQAGVSDPFAMSMYTFAAGIVGTTFAIWCSYRVLGRRAMLLFGTAGAVVCMAAAALGGTVSPGSPQAAKNFMAWNVIYSVVYGGFAATIAWPISAEVVSSKLRVLTLSVATAIDYVFAWLIAFCSPYFINPRVLNWGMKYCWLWAGANVVTLGQRPKEPQSLEPTNNFEVFFYFLLQEMKGRSLEEIDELFEKRISVKDFPTYECECTKQAREIATQKVETAVLHSELGLGEEEKGHKSGIV